MPPIRPNTNQRSANIPVDDDLEAAIVLDYTIDENGDPQPLGALLQTILGGVDNDRDTNNEQTGLLLATQVFTGQYTAVSVYQSFLVLYASFQPFTALLRWSADGVNPAGGLLGTTTLTVQQDEATGYYFFIHVGNTMLNEYYRLEVTNGASDQTAGVISLGLLQNHPISGTVGSLGSALTINSIAQLVRAVQAGVSPTGSFDNVGSDGIAFTEDTPLGIAGVFESEWIPTMGWRSVELLIDTDQISANEGIEVEYTDDASAVTPVVRATRTRNFTAEDVARGFAIFRFGTALDGLRVRYTNGATAQTVFFLGLTLRISTVELPQMPINAQIDATQNAVVTRSEPFGLAPGGAGYVPVGVTVDGEQYSSLENVTVPVPLKPATTGDVDVIALPNAGGSGTLLGGLANRKSILVMAHPSNTKIIFFGFSSNPAAIVFPLAAGVGIPIAITEAVTVYGYAVDAGQSICIVEVGGTP